MTLLRGQSDVSAQVPMPTERVDDAATVSTATTETVTWFYVTSSAWASATGQAAGTLVWGKLTYRNVLNSNKAALGSLNNTSLTLGAATRLDVLVSIPDDTLSKMQFMTPTEQKAEALKHLTTQGYYAVDHRRGQIWGLQKATVANDTATYSYISKGAASTDITSIVPGTGATNLGKAEDGVHTSGDVGVMVLAIRSDTASAKGADGDYVPLLTNSTGHEHVAEGFAPNYEEQTLNRALTLSAPVTSTTYNLSLDKSAALEASSVTKASAGNLYWVSGRIDSTAPTATYYYQVLSAASLPSDGAVTYLVAPMKLQHTTGTDTPIAIGNPSNAVTPIAGSATGLVECLSSTEFTKTITAAYLSTTVGYL